MFTFTCAVTGAGFFCGLRQNVGRIHRIAERTCWHFANRANVICSTRRAGRNFIVPRQFDVWRQIRGKINGVTIGFIVLQRKLIGGGINLAEVIDASIGRRRHPGMPVRHGFNDNEVNTERNQSRYDRQKKRIRSKSALMPVFIHML
ncbi:MAG TPA: hypothetical protein VG347_22565 [Verrucomicrobiae bacterium]|nr:hypothetical protein [Verrucomicrobiae bacterium]